MNLPIINKEIFFDSIEKGKWIQRIAEEQTKIHNGLYRSAEATVKLCQDLTLDTLTPLHLVTLACFVQLLKKSGCLRGNIKANQDVIDHFIRDLHLPEYFSSATPHVKSENEYNLNLWKISSKHAATYSQHVADYLKRNYFVGKDLSGLKVVLDELYANIADHSEADIAYSFIKYDETEETIKIAFCDFGIGIKASLLKGGASAIENFIYAATLKGVTAKSNTHNRGYGLDTVVSSINDSGNLVRILSGNELFISYGSNANQRTWPLDFDFKGTLIYFDLPISSFEDADYLEDFEL